MKRKAQAAADTEKLERFKKATAAQAMRLFQTLILLRSLGFEHGYGSRETLRHMD